MDVECGECRGRVRFDWSACPWCAVPFAWSLMTATQALTSVLEEAGAFTIARRVRLRYSRLGYSFVAKESDRDIALAAQQLRYGRRRIGSWERARRLLGRDRYFALDHPLHVPLHEAGHVFQHYLCRRRLIDLDEAAAVIGDLSAPYPVDDTWRRIVVALRGRDRSFVSAYATVHPSEDFAETFAVVAFLRAEPAALRAFARYNGKGPAVLRALEWIAGLVRRHGR